MATNRLITATDLRSTLPRAAWSIGVRAETTNITWHYHGAEVEEARQWGAGLITQLKADARYHMRKGWGGTKEGADGLQYHVIFASDGTVYQARNLDTVLWHCAHQEGNGRGLSLHFPIGGTQAPTPAMIAAAIRTTDTLRVRYSIPRDRVFGHLEWKHATACPGVSLMRILRAYRGGANDAPDPTPLPPTLRLFRLSPHLLGSARVRQGPGTRFKVATTLKPGTVVYVDVVKQGGAVEGNTNWIHMARVENEQADAGFISETLGAWV